MEVDLSLEERLAQAMIDLRKGHTPNTKNPCNIHQKRDYLIETIKNIKKNIDLLRRENNILKELEEKTVSIRYQINPIREIDAHLIKIKHEKCHDTRDISIQTDPVSTHLPNIPHKAEKFKIINNLSIRERMLQAKLRNLQLATNHRGQNYILLKMSEYKDIVSQIASMSPADSTSFRDMEIENDTNIPTTNVQSNYLSGGSTSTSTKIGMTNTTSGSNNGMTRSHEESDDEGVQLLLSMKRNVFNCKCGEYLNSITDWSEHQKICTKSSEKST